MHDDPYGYGLSMGERFLLFLLILLVWPAVLLAFLVRRLMHRPSKGKRYRQVWAMCLFVATPVGFLLLYFVGHPLEVIRFTFTGLVDLFVAVLRGRAVDPWGVILGLLLLWLESVALFPPVTIVLEILKFRKAEEQAVERAGRRDAIIATRSQAVAEQLKGSIPDEVGGEAVFGRVIDLTVKE